MSIEIIDGKTLTLIPVSAPTGVTGGRCYRQGFTYSVSERAAGVTEGENTNDGFGRTKHTFPIHHDNPGIFSSAGYPLSDYPPLRGLTLLLRRVSLAQCVNYSAMETSAVRITGKKYPGLILPCALSENLPTLIPGEIRCLPVSR